jgi:hypothetical protein
MATRSRKKVNLLSVQEAIKELIELEDNGHRTSQRYLQIRVRFPRLNTQPYRKALQKSS